jgi:transposase InsO family protein
VSPISEGLARCCQVSVLSSGHLLNQGLSLGAGGGSGAPGSATRPRSPTRSAGSCSRFAASTYPMREKRLFIEAVLAKHYSMSELCRQFGISRKTGYKWWRRFQEAGLPGLAELDRVAYRHPHATSEQVVKLVISARRAHPSWGPRKLRAWLTGRGHGDVVPAASTIGAILQREGLVGRTRRRLRPGEFTSTLTEQKHPNAVWAADFKGQFSLRGGPKCYPLTITDGFSRYLLRCQALLHPTSDETQAVFEAAFYEYGLPDVMRTDNGVPFSSRSGISALSVWWVKLGIRPERTARGKPTQNGRHERMHRTLKMDAIRPEMVKGSQWAQQRVFDRFRKEFNEERPHEALGQRPPSSLYRLSSRTYPTPLREPQYDQGYEVQRAGADGSVVVGGRRYALSTLLRREPIGLQEQEDGRVTVHYGPLELATISVGGRLTRGRKKTRSRPEGLHKSGEKTDS